MKNSYLFTSESVSEGHPDKVADQVSDAVLDAMLVQDPNSRVACEALIKTNLLVIAGEIRSNAEVDIVRLAREVIRDIGYEEAQEGFDPDSAVIINSIGQQSKDIAVGVDESNTKKQGAGDQGIMFGYASNETESSMPLPIMLAHALMQKHSALRRSKALHFLRPDAKSQVTVEYENGKPVHIDTVLISTQHTPDVSDSTLREGVIEEIIKSTLPQDLISSKTKFLVNPTGIFVVGGPKGDCGLTGRKIIVDTYGGFARHGGGAFSGKDPSKVDRSAAYAARWVAKSVVKKGYADRCEVQLSYAIGVPEPVSIFINAFGTNTVSEEEIKKYITETFDLTPEGIIHSLKLKRPIYQKTAAHGHFGRLDSDFTWEQGPPASKNSSIEESKQPSATSSETEHHPSS